LSYVSILQVRYHHDGKYNVMSMDGPLEIYGANPLLNTLGWFLDHYFTVVKPSDLLTFTTVRESLMHVVPLCLDSDPSLIPLSCKSPSAGDGGVAQEVTFDIQPESFRGEGDSDQAERDADDFSFWSEKQAKRICTAIKQIFDVDYAPEVVLADANLAALANRILVSKEILCSTTSAS
jgi:phosphatidylethanolamine N-methyltransferase